MNKIKQQHYLNKEMLASDELDFFFEIVLKRLGLELEKLRNTLFNNYDTNPTFYEDLFGLNERAWVGAFNNAIIRAFPEADTLQEFTVYNDSDDGVKRNFYGRADLLVHWKNTQGKSIHLLFEAKQYLESDYSKMHEDASEFFKEIHFQGKGYVEADKFYYQNKIVYIVPIVFGWLRGNDFINNAMEYFNKTDVKEDFCSLFFEDKSGVWVYGSVESPKKITS